MIQMENWRVTVPPEDVHIGYEQDHLAATLAIQTDAPPGWDYRLDIEIGGTKNVIALDYTDGVLSVLLTRSMLAADGSYRCQVRGAKGDTVRHSNKFVLYVSDSINASEAFPAPLPSEFEQLEKRVTDVKNEAEGYALNPPKIGENGNWLIYTDGGYIDSSINAQGETPYIKNGNWWIGAVDTGVSAYGQVVEVITNSELEEMLK